MTRWYVRMWDPCDQCRRRGWHVWSPGGPDGRCGRLYLVSLRLESGIVRSHWNQSRALAMPFEFRGEAIRVARLWRRTVAVRVGR